MALLSPSDEWRSDPEFAQYLAELGAYSVEKLRELNCMISACHEDCVASHNDSLPDHCSTLRAVLIGRSKASQTQLAMRPYCISEVAELIVPLVWIAFSCILAILVTKVLINN